MTRIIVNRDWCKGCYLCINVCPHQVLDVDKAVWTGSFHPVIVRQIERCKVCRSCELFCPDLAIEVLEDE